MPDLTGHSFGRYTLLEQLGEGGMAIVYKAYDTRLERDVAVKIIRRGAFPPDHIERMLKRFEREGRALARLSHPNIMKVLDYGEHEGSPYLVMEYLQSGTLKEKMGKPIPWQEAIQMLLPIAEALDYAHSQNMIHRDVKPANILLAQNGQPMLTDFGIAKILDLEETLELTGTSAAIGTPEYMAPEQATAKNVDRRADVYSLGIVLYEMVTGRKPFSADTPMAVLIMHAHDPLPSPKKYVPNLPNGVEQALLKALAKKPDGRYQSMREVVNAFEKLQKDGGKQPAFAAKSTSASKLPIKPNTLMIIFGLAALVLLAVFGLPALMGKPQSTPIATSTESLKTSTSIPATATQALTSTPTLTSTPEGTATPKLDVGSTMTRPTDRVVMAYIPAGEFSMGSANGNGNEQPVHTVYLDAFWIDQTELANGMYVKCMDAGVCDDPGKGKRASAQGVPNHPTTATWEMANTYCKWAGGRLPTEAEWEKAARGGLAGKKYPWGDEAPTCREGAVNGAKTHNCGQQQVKVKTFAPNGYGLYDMMGNLWEWVNDWYASGYYGISPSSNPTGPNSGDSHVLRGGSFCDYIVGSSLRGNLGSKGCIIGSMGGTGLNVPGNPVFTIDSLVGFRCAYNVNP